MPKKTTPKTKTAPPELPVQLAKARLLGTLTKDNESALTLAYKLGITNAEVEFSGSGDSGDIDVPQLLRPRQPSDPTCPWYSKQEPMQRVDKTRVDYVEVGDGSPSAIATSSGRFNGVSSPNPEWTEDHEILRSLVRSISTEKVEGCGVDWYNNEGGGGHVTFDFTTGEVEFYVYANEVKVAHEETNTFNLFGGEAE